MELPVPYWKHKSIENTQFLFVEFAKNAEMAKFCRTIFVDNTKIYYII